MKSLKGTQTEKNLLISFSSESQARNRYTYFASTAKSEGYIQISDIFTETANQEKEHAKRLFKFLEGGELEVAYTYPAGIISDTTSNLINSAAGERHEHTEMYPQFAQTAQNEGFGEIATVLRCIAIAEEFHERRFLDFARNIKEGRVFTREKATTWRCRNCGYLHNGTGAPHECPACAHPQAHFELLGINW